MEIPTEKEDLLLDLINESKKNLKLSGSVSKRLSTKKLTVSWLQVYWKVVESQVEIFFVLFFSVCVCVFFF